MVGECWLAIFRQTGCALTSGISSLGLGLNFRSSICESRRGQLSVESRTRPLSWCDSWSSHQIITVNYGISGPKFASFFIRDVERTCVHPLSHHPLWNATPKKEGVSSISADLAPKIGCHGNVPWPIAKPMPDRASIAACYTNPENLVKIGLIVSEISLLQAIVKKDEERKKQQQNISPAGFQPGVLKS